MFTYEKPLRLVDQLLLNVTESCLVLEQNRNTRNARPRNAKSYDKHVDHGASTVADSL